MAYISTRLTNSGTYLVNGSFDEFTGIPVVNNSLVLWLDAGQPTSYSGSGATWTDLSGNGYNGTLTGSPTYSSNNTGGALTFNGSSQYVTMAGLASSAFTSITLSIWVNASITVGSGSFIAKELCYKYRLEPSGSIGLLIGTGAAWSLVTTFPAYTYTAGTWVNIAVTVNSTNVIGYINGVQKFSNGTGYTIGSNALPFNIASYNNTAEVLTGSVGAAMVYNRALSAAEIVQNYNALAPRYLLSTISTGTFVNRVTTTTVYANLLDEVSLPYNSSNPAMRNTNTGTLMVSTGFDEFTGAPIVDSSLLQWIDAAQPASYPGSGTTLFNLGNISSGTNYSTYTSEFTNNQGGLFILNTTTQIASLSNVNINSSEFTVSVWGMQTITDTRRQRWITVGTAGDSITMRNDGAVGIGQFHYYMTLNGVIGGGTIRVNSSITPGQIANYVGTYNGTQMVLYKNGASIGSSAVSGIFTGTSLNIRLGSISNEGLVGNIHQSQIYNRAFSADEILQNFNALRRRYSI